MRYRLKGLALAVVAGLAGCAGTKTAGVGPPPAGENSAAFLDRVSSQAYVSQDDAMRGILMLQDGRDETTSFQQRLTLVQERNIVPRSWDLDPDAPITRGKLAYMIYQSCKIPGGVILTLTGPSQRYCLRELQYREMMPGGVFYSPVTGMEFVGVLAKAEAYRRTGRFPETFERPQSGE